MTTRRNGRALVALCVGCLSVLLLASSRRLWRLWEWSGRPTASWLGADRCPLCYGVDACALLADGVDFGCEGRAAGVLALLGDKNVAFGCPRATDDRLVLKRLGHDWELDGLDARVCEPFGEGCDHDSVADLEAALAERIRRAVEPDPARARPGLVVCRREAASAVLAPSIRRGGPPLDRVALLNAWTLLNINAEPVALRFLEASGLPWPVPEYLGACGRTAVTRRAGEPLSSRRRAPFADRAAAAGALLAAADAFTFAHPALAVYLLDVGSDNVAVDPDDFRNVTFVDLEDVAFASRDGGRKAHVTRHEPGDGLPFSLADLCSHGVSDHNHYAVCRLIADELLTDAPETSTRVHAAIVECVSPTAGDRFAAAEALAAALRNETARIRSEALLETPQR